MDFSAVSKIVRRPALLASAIAILSLAISGVTAYAVMAAPLRSIYVPNTVSFQGVLTDADGIPVSDGDYTLTFNLYDVAEGGTVLWTETQIVTTSDGLYSVQLGSLAPLSPSDFGGNRWLGIRVDGDAEMTPRIVIGAVPFALNAHQAMGLQGYDVSANAPSDGDVLQWDAELGEWVPGVGVSAGVEVPVGGIILVEGACPAGFSEYTAAQGRYVVGVPQGGTVGAAVGTALSDQENRSVGQHSHTINDPGHSHIVKEGDWMYYIGYDQTSYWATVTGSRGTPPNTRTSTTGITINNEGSVAGTNAPYIQLTYCQREP